MKKIFFVLLFIFETFYGQMALLTANKEVIFKWLYLSLAFLKGYMADIGLTYFNLTIKN